MSCFWAPTPKILAVFRVINALSYVMLADRGQSLKYRGRVKFSLTYANKSQVIRIWVIRKFETYYLCNQRIPNPPVNLETRQFML